MTKMKNVTNNRRISLSFRDSALTIIFKNNLNYTKNLIEQYNTLVNQNSPNISLISETLEVCLDTYLKCLQFDFIAVLLNETLDEPSQTNLPAAWEKEVEDPDTLNVLFFAVNMLLDKIQMMVNMNAMKQYIEKAKKMIVTSLRCLIEYANVRLSIF